MTEHQLTKLVETWAGRLGIGHWHIEVNVLSFDEALTAARVECSGNYEAARIDFQPYVLDGRVPEGCLVRRFDLEQTVVHELLHVCMQPLHRATSLIDDGNNLHRDVQALFEAAFTQREEELVDRLAWGLVNAWREA